MFLAIQRSVRVVILIFHLFPPSNCLAEKNASNNNNNKKLLRRECSTTTGFVSFSHTHLLSSPDYEHMHNVGLNNYAVQSLRI